VKPAGVSASPPATKTFRMPPIAHAAS